MAKVKTQVSTTTVVNTPSGVERLKSLIETVGQSELEIAFVVAEVYQTEEFKNYGFQTFQEFGESLDFSYRKLLWLLQIGQTCKLCNITLDDLAKTGIEWTKLKELCHLITSEMTKEDIQTLLVKGKNMSYKEVETFVRKEKTVRVGGELVKKETMKFSFIGDQINTVNLALEVACEKIGTDNKSQALEYICGEWLQNYSAVPAPIQSPSQPVEQTPTPRKKRADIIKKEI